MAIPTRWAKWWYIKKSESYIFKAKITGKAGNHGITNAEIVLPLNT